MNDQPRSDPTPLTIAAKRSIHGRVLVCPERTARSFLSPEMAIQYNGSAILVCLIQDRTQQWYTRRPDKQLPDCGHPAGGWPSHSSHRRWVLPLFTGSGFGREMYSPDSTSTGHGLTSAMEPPDRAGNPIQERIRKPRMTANSGHEASFSIYELDHWSELLIEELPVHPFEQLEPGC